MPVTNYYAVDSELIGEATGGVRTDYLTDGLGSVTGTVNASGSVVNTYRYKPYGSQLSKSGVGSDPAFLWVGSHGYRQTGKTFSEVYVRARHYETNRGRWTTVDPLWPKELQWLYVSANPSTFIDPTGKTQEAGDSPPSFGASPMCSEVLNCLNDPNRKRCEKSKGQLGHDNELFLCISQQETSFLYSPDPKKPGTGGRGGIANLTPPAFKQLLEEGCSWLKKFKDYEDFAKNATNCEKAQAAQDYLGSRYISRKGLIAYGPPYPSETVKKLKRCADKLKRWHRECYKYGGPMPSDPDYEKQKEKFCKYVLRDEVHPD